MPCQMAGSKRTEVMMLLVEQSEVTLHGGHGAMMSDGGLEEDRGNAAAPRASCFGAEGALEEDRGNAAAP